MDISEAMLRYYIEYVTLSYYGRNDLPPDDLEGYRPFLDNLVLVAREEGDLAEFRLGLEALFADPATDWEGYAATRYPYDAAEAKEVVQYIRAALTQDLGEPPAAEVRQVRLTAATLEEWRAARGR